MPGNGSGKGEVVPASTFMDFISALAQVYDELFQSEQRVAAGYHLALGFGHQIQRFGEGLGAPAGCTFAQLIRPVRVIGQ